MVAVCMFAGGVGVGVERDVIVEVATDAAVAVGVAPGGLPVGVVIVTVGDGMVGKLLGVAVGGGVVVVFPPPA